MRNYKRFAVGLIKSDKEVMHIKGVDEVNKLICVLIVLSMFALLKYL